MEETRKDKLQLIVRRFFLIITDIILVNGCVFISLVMRFNVDLAAIESQYIQNFKSTCVPFTLITLLIFWCFRMYHSLWQYASIAEVYRIAEACIIVELVHFLSIFYGMDASTFMLFYIRSISYSCNVCEPFYVQAYKNTFTGIQTYIRAD